MQSIHSLKAGDLVKVLNSEDVKGLVQATYEDWLHHKPEWTGQVGTVISFDIYLNGKVLVCFQNELAYVSKIFLELVQSLPEDVTMP